MSDPAGLLTPGALVRGLEGSEIVEILGVEPAGSGAYVRYRDEIGLTASRMLSDAELLALAPVHSSGPTLNANIEQFQLAVEALRIRHAHALTPSWRCRRRTWNRSPIRCRPSTATSCANIPKGSCWRMTRALEKL